MRMYLYVQSLVTLMFAFLSSLYERVVEKTIETFSLKNVYVYSTAIAFISFSLLGVFSTLAYAQEVPSDSGLFQYIMENFMNAKSAGTIALALFVSKALLYASNTPTFGKLLDKLTGKMKLVVSLVLTYVVGVLSVMVVQHVSLAVALFDSANIPLLGLLLNQIYKQFVVKAEEPPKAAQ